MATTEPIPAISISQPPLNATFMGVVLGVAQYYDTGVTTAEYFAESGYGYAVNIHPELCPSGPYCWNHQPILDSLRKLGIDGVRLGSGYDANTREARELIEEKVQRGFLEGVVSMEGLEHQLIVECNHERMVFAMPWDNEIDTCMKELECEDWRNVKEPPPFGFYRFDKSEIASKEVRVRQAVSAAKAAYETPMLFEIEDYKYGPNAYDTWLNALQRNLGDQHGQWWNCTVWGECRHFASEYFRNGFVGSNHHTDELAGIFKESSDLLSEASVHDLSNDRKSDLILEVQALEKRVLPLLVELESEFS